MLQQTQVATVIPYFEKFLKLWPSFEAMAAADDADVMSAWAGLGYYARARNMLACARAVAAEGMPQDEAALRALPGVGDYTAAAVAAIAFGQRAVVVDGNVERVVARLFAVSDPLPAAKPKIKALADSITPDARAGDFAQAMMDLGSGICTPKSPKCLLCPLRQDCAGFASGDPTAFPVKTRKAASPQRYGTIFWGQRDGKVLLVRRPDKGLLGGMRALPTGPWVDAPPGLAGAPVTADWHMLGMKIAHVFTHFRLECALAVATIGAQEAPSPEILGGEWWPMAEIESAGLPTIFAKAAKAFGRAECE